MTQITSITGLAGDLKDRGKYVSSKAPYIPYTAMTNGEMKLALLQDEFLVKSALYPEVKAYRSAADMYGNALNAGVSQGINFVGALYDPVLQQAAANITKAVKDTRPAAKAFIGRKSLADGVRIGEGPVYTGDFDHDCVQYATKLANRKYNINKDWTWWNNKSDLFGPDKAKRAFWNETKNDCEIRVAVEKILNTYMVDTAHHIVYKNMGTAFKPIIGSQVLTKKILHYSGVGGLANVSSLTINLMDSWAEMALKRKNATLGAGTSNSVSTSLALAPDPERYVQEYNQYLKANPKDDIKYDAIGRAYVGEPVTIIVTTVVIPLIAAITKAAAEANRMAENLRAKKEGALATVQGYGTPAFSADKTDYLTQGSDTGDNSNLLLLGGAALLGYAFFKK